MADNSITDKHFYKWIGNSDVNEEIDVYKDYINYENYCPGCWEDYLHFGYKIEGDKLYVRYIDFERVEFSKGYKGVLFSLVKGGKINDDGIKKYLKFRKQYEYCWQDVERRLGYKKNLENRLGWFEFKPYGRFRYTNEAKKWIIKQIKNKNFKDK